MYLCPQCDWIICDSCYRVGWARVPNTAVARHPLTPKSDQVDFIEKSSSSYKKIPSEKPAIKMAPGKLSKRAPKQQNLAPKKRLNLLACIKKNIFGTEQYTSRLQNGSSVVGTPERIMADIDKIRGLVRVVRGVQRRSASRRDFRSPRDYSYSPRRRRRSRSYQRYSYSLSSTSSSEDIEYSPIRSPWRRRGKRRRVAYY